jgi:protein-tyrosine phosphatase
MSNFKTQPAAQAAETSVLLPFSSVRNCRDLGGMPAAGGSVIKPGLLIRSADLAELSAVDAATFENMNLKDVVDLRTQWEVDAHPDLVPKSAALHHLPPLHADQVAKAVETKHDWTKDNAEDFTSAMSSLYADMISDPLAVHAWKSLFDILLHTENAILWHCTQGKDRTGMAAVLIEHALGVPANVIEADYLATNQYLKSELDDAAYTKMAELLKDTPFADEPELLLFARKEYLQSAENRVKELYGTWDAYLQKAIGLQKEDIQSLQERLLEQPDTVQA